MIAILKIGSSNELVVTKKNKLYYAFTLTEGNVLNETYKYLKGMPVKELRVILTPVVKVSSTLTDDIQISEFKGEGLDRKCFVSRHDVDKLKILTANLDLDKLKIYSMFDLFRLIGKRKPSVICGKYLGNFVYYIYLDKNGVRDFREAKEVDTDVVNNLLKFSETKNVISEFNLELDGVIRNRFTNIADLRDYELEKLYPNLCTDFLSPNLEIAVTPGDTIVSMTLPTETMEEEYEEEEEILDEEVQDSLEDNLDDELNEEMIAVTSSKRERGKRNRGGRKEERTPKQDMAPNRLLDIGLTVVGVILAVILSLSLFSNKQLPAETKHIEEKSQQLEEVIAPMKDNANYLNNYTKVLSNGGPTDVNVIEQLGKISIDGVLSEVVLNQKEVGLIVYLADEKSIDAFTTELGKIMTVSEVSKEGKLGLDSTSLNKFIIHGTLK